MRGDLLWMLAGISSDMGEQDPDACADVYGPCQWLPPGPGPDLTELVPVIARGAHSRPCSCLPCRDAEDDTQDNNEPKG